MGYRLLFLNFPTGCTEEELQRKIARRLGIREFSYRVQRKSLDARKKSDIHWALNIGVSSPEISGGTAPVHPELHIPRTGKGRGVFITGSGPAGIFAALVLQKAGFSTTLIERGKDVTARAEGIRTFEEGGRLDPRGNYAFGEGGAGTFSDGKLTSRSKHIGAERRFILDSYIRAGAPEEIAFLTHPHLGSDNLKIITKNLRKEYQDLGGTLHFETLLTDLRLTGSRVTEAVTDRGSFPADYFILAPGHSAYETYRMLMNRGVAFVPKNFALGSRMEHPRALINTAQWGRESLPGVKAAEYRLTFNRPGSLPVYTFCMCPGGIIVPAEAYPDRQVVNGMSMYNRDLPYSNAACVAAINPLELYGEDAGPKAVLDRIEELEISFREYSTARRAPCCGIDDFIHRRGPGTIAESSYPLGLEPAPLWELLPEGVSDALREALRDFSRTLKGFETGIILGLESKTSAPLQAPREKDSSCPGLENLYIAGEGSGRAGGIISSAADGIKTALSIC